MRCRAATHGVYRVHGGAQCAFADERGFGVSDRGGLLLPSGNDAGRVVLSPRGNSTRRRRVEIFAENIVTQWSTKRRSANFFDFAANQSVTGAF